MENIQPKSRAPFQQSRKYSEILFSQSIQEIQYNYVHAISQRITKHFCSQKQSKKLSAILSLEPIQET